MTERLALGCVDCDGRLDTIQEADQHTRDTMVVRGYDPDDYASTLRFVEEQDERHDSFYVVAGNPGETDLAAAAGMSKDKARSLVRGHLEETDCGDGPYTDEEVEDYAADAAQHISIPQNLAELHEQDLAVLVLAGIVAGD